MLRLIFLGMLTLGLGTFFEMARAAEIRVDDDDSLRRAVMNARPGTQVKIAPGNYQPRVRLSGLRGTAEQPIVIEGSDEENPPVFAGGNEAWHLSDCAHVTLRNLAIRGQKHNGINIDDGGTYDTPTHHIVLENIRVSEIGPKGNYDGIKLSGLDDFVLRNCEIEGWGGSAVDMVGCHRGVIDDCILRGRQGHSQNTGIQAKGGTSEIVVRRCRFLDAGARAVNIGGSTGLQFFRPQRAKYEARDITVEGCTFIGSEAPVAFVGVDGATVSHNTIYHPRKWVMRILQETTAPGFVSCRKGRFEGNLIVFRRADVRTFVNIGPHTQPQSFSFAKNWWYCEDRPASGRPQLPTPESDGVYSVDPELKNPRQNDFAPRNQRALEFGATAFEP